MAVTITTNVDESRGAVAVLIGNSGPGAATVTLERSAGVGGVTAVRKVTGYTIPDGGSVAVVDPEAPIGVSFTYRVLNASTGAVLATSGAILLDGPWVVDGVAAFAILKHLFDTSLSTPVLIKSIDELTRPSVSDTFRPLGAKLPVVTAQPRGGREGTIELVSLSAEHTQKIVDLLADGSVVQLVTLPRFDLEGDGLYMAVGDWSEQRFVSENGDEETRVLSLDIVEVLPPDPGAPTASAYSWAGVVADYTSWTDLLATGPATWGDLLLSMGE